MNALAGKRILLVEDEPIVAMMVEDMLTELGAVVVGPASTLDRALALVEANDLDAALLDVNLGHERSHGVARLLAERGVPFVFATGYGDAGSDGFTDAPVIQKPYREEQLAAVLERAIASAPAD